MSQSSRRPPSRRPTARVVTPPPEKPKLSRRRTAIIWSVVVAVVLGLAIGIGYYVIYALPLQQTIIKVNSAEITADYFIRRMLQSGGAEDIFTMMQTITNEELIRQGAPRAPYGIRVTDEEVTSALKEAARGENETISEPEFRAWYRNEVNESGLSDREYRDLTRTYLMAQLLGQYLGARVPSVAEQVHLQYMVFESYEDAVEAAGRLEEGADFAELAREVSIDTVSAEEGGDLGWWPEDALGIQSGTALLSPPSLLFDFGTGEVSQPALLDQDTMVYAIFKVVERAAAMEMEEDMLNLVKQRQMEKWLDTEMRTQTITFHGRNNGFDSETHAWITWQLSRRQK